VATLGLAAITVMGCGSDDGQTQGAAFNLIVSERTWIDTSRTIPRTPQRELRTVIWDAGARAPQPLLILAHGFGGLPEKFDALARAIASAGFLVAAPAFPLTNQNAPGGHEGGLGDFRNQPADVSFIITQLLAANDDPDDDLFERIDPLQIALLGHSLGGVTALASARKDCCFDPRIKALIAVAPLVMLFLNQFGADSISEGPPTLIIHGKADSVIPLQSSIDLYGQLGGPKFLIGLTDVDHSEALESQEQPPPPARGAAEAATIAFLQRVFLDDSQPLQELLDDLAADGHLTEATP
jgi:predicted dienelactone hydrolase